MKRLNYIVQCLETWKEAYPESWYEPSELALTYARELRELEPVGVCVEATRYSQNDVDWYSYTPDAGTKLYALGDKE